MPENRPNQTQSSCCSPPVLEIASEPCDCSGPPATTETRPLDEYWIDGTANTQIGDISHIETTLCFKDRLGAWKARWGINRMNYIVKPGLYAFGSPTSESPVFVSANYKMSFDSLRSSLDALTGWILVLDTKGINVWCAAGKGTFGTDELLNRIQFTQLDRIVSHRKLILPQLGAPGVNMHEVKRQSGFRVQYGPVRAQDIPAFMESGMKASPEMRRMFFPLYDRVVLIPTELMMSLKFVLIIAASLFVLSGLIPWGYSLSNAVSSGFWSVAIFVGLILSATVLTPVLLPWLPGRSFSVKGFWVGLAFIVSACGYAWFNPGLFENWADELSWLLIGPAVASFIAMNFTGSSTYTSLSGVRKEMRQAVPIQAVCAVLGLGLWLASQFL